MSKQRQVMCMVGIMMEKPSAARDMAKALGGMKGTYQGTAYVIVALRGHLFEFCEPAEQVDEALRPQYKSWALKNLPWNETDFHWKREKKKDTSALLKDIKATLSGCDEICFGGDVDASGEGALIDLEVVEELRLTRKKFSRMYFYDQSVKSLQAGFSQRKPIPDIRAHDECLKAYYRQRWDFLSQQFTRIATHCGDGRAVLRQGRLKSAMVLITGDGLKALKGYKKIPFYQNRFRDENGVMYTNPDEPVFPNKGDVQKTYGPSPVTVDSKTNKTKAPPRLVDLAMLSAMLASKGVKAKTVLSVYQKMYEAQVVSYPRTDDKTITPEQFNELLPLCDKIARVVGVDPKLLTHKTPRSTHVKNKGAHGANRPGPNVPGSMSELSAKFGDAAPLIYDILARSYLAMLCEDYEYEAQKGHVAKYPAFVGTASVPRKQGWKAVYQTGDASDDEEDSNANGLGTKAEPFVYEGFPPKPPTPTWKWLQKQLEKYDVGTGATRTSIFAEVTNDKAKYPLISETRGKLSLTEYGDMSYQLLPGTNIGNLKMTEQLYADMREIASGKLDPDKALAGIQKLVREDMETMARNGQKIEKKAGAVMSGATTEKEYYEGSWKGKKVKFNRVYSGHRFTDAECRDLCDGKEIEIELTSAKTGKPYGAVGRLANLEYNGHKYVGFERTGFAQSKTPSVPGSWCGHTFTDDERALLELGNPVKLVGVKSKKGSTFDCRVCYGKKKDGTTGIIPEFDKENWPG